MQGYGFDVFVAAAGVATSALSCRRISDWLIVGGDIAADVASTLRSRPSSSFVAMVQVVSASGVAASDPLVPFTK